MHYVMHHAMHYVVHYVGRAGVLEFVARHVTDAEAAAWIRANARTVQLDYFAYSWALNRTPPAV